MRFIGGYYGLPDWMVSSTFICYLGDFKNWLFFWGGKMRYVLKFGKFGMYFYDTKDFVDLTLFEILTLLNRGITK